MTGAPPQYHCCHFFPPLLCQSSSKSCHQWCMSYFHSINWLPASAALVSGLSIVLRPVYPHSCQCWQLRLVHSWPHITVLCMLNVQRFPGLQHGMLWHSLPNGDIVFPVGKKLFFNEELLSFSIKKPPLCFLFSDSPRPITYNYYEFAVLLLKLVRKIWI